MWMMTKIGFFSIVEKPKGKVCIRARCRQDLENLLEEVLEFREIVETPKADYPYRIVLPREEFMRYFDTFLKLVTYNNFKNEVRKTNKHREGLYHQVWAILRQIETEEREEED